MKKAIVVSVPERWEKRTKIKKEGSLGSKKGAVAGAPHTVWKRRLRMRFGRWKKKERWKKSWSLRTDLGKKRGRGGGFQTEPGAKPTIGSWDALEQNAEGSGGTKKGHFVKHRKWGRPRRKRIHAKWDFAQRGRSAFVRGRWARSK